MDELVTVLTFSSASEMAIVRGHLESEGIECFVQDELTVQVNPFFSNAVGGIKLQVKKSDLNAAVEILKETGYLRKSYLEKSEDFPDYDKYFNKIPFLKKQKKTIRMLFAAAFIAILIVVIVILSVLLDT